MSKKGLKKFLVGSAIGAGLGMLFAPKKGSESRDEIKKLFDEFKEKLTEIDIDETKLQVEAKIDEIKEALTELDKETVLKQAKTKTKELQKKVDELVKYAKNAKAPILEEMAEKAKAKAISTTKEILEKLESKETKDK